MRKILYFILSLIGLAYIVISSLYLINLSVQFLSPEMLKMFSYIMLYGPVAIIGGFCFVNFFGKSLKIIFFILLILAIVLFILACVKPDLFQFLA